MRTVLVPNVGVFVIALRHKQLDITHWLLGIGRRPRRKGWTECRILAPDGLHGWLGRAECSRKDPFTKAVGRQLALQRAINAVSEGYDHDSGVREVFTARCEDWLAPPVKRVQGHAQVPNAGH